MSELEIAKEVYVEHNDMLREMVPELVMTGLYGVGEPISRRDGK